MTLDEVRESAQSFRPSVKSEREAELEKEMVGLKNECAAIVEKRDREISALRQELETVRGALNILYTALPSSFVLLNSDWKIIKSALQLKEERNETID